MTYPTAVDRSVTRLGAPMAHEPDYLARRAVLLSWCRANTLDPDRMLDRDRIEIHPATGTATGRRIIYREVVPASPDMPHRETRTRLAQTPLIVEPAGLLTGDSLTCGHIHTTPSPVADAAPLWFVCDRYIDPRTGRHPAEHCGHPPPAGDDTGTVRRMTWPNEHRGHIAFHAGIASAVGLLPNDAYSLALARLEAAADHRPRDRRPGPVDLGQHLRGLRELAHRHRPHVTATAGTVCDHDYATAIRITPWPCADLRLAFTGILVFTPEGGNP